MFFSLIRSNRNYTRLEPYPLFRYRIVRLRKTFSMTRYFDIDCIAGLEQGQIPPKRISVNWYEKEGMGFELKFHAGVIFSFLNNIKGRDENYSIIPNRFCLTHGRSVIRHVLEMSSGSPTIKLRYSSLYKNFLSIFMSKRTPCFLLK